MWSMFACTLSFFLHIRKESCHHHKKEKTSKKPNLCPLRDKCDTRGKADRQTDRQTDRRTDVYGIVHVCTL